MCYSNIFSYLQAHNFMFLFINIAVVSVSPKMPLSGTIFNCPVCRSNVCIWATVPCQLLPYFDFSAVRNTGIIDFEFNPQ